MKIEIVLLSSVRHHYVYPTMLSTSVYKSKHITKSYYDGQDYVVKLSTLLH